MSEGFLWEMWDGFWDRERTVVTVHLELEEAQSSQIEYLHKEGFISCGHAKWALALLIWEVLQSQ